MFFYRNTHVYFFLIFFPQIHGDVFQLAKKKKRIGRTIRNCTICYSHRTYT